MASSVNNQLGTDEFAVSSSELARARRECPVFHDAHGIVNVTRYDDVVEVITESGTYSSGVLRLPPLPDQFRGKLPENILSSVQLNLDPPAHTVVRRAVTRAFSGRRMTAMEPAIHDIARSLVDGFAAQGECELMSSYCYQLMTKIFPAMLGLGEEDMRRLTALNEDVFSLMMQAGSFGPLDTTMSPEEIEERYSPSAVVQRYDRMVEAWAHLGRILDARREDPRDDLTSAMIQTTDDAGNPAFSNDEMIVHMISLLAAAAETTGNLVGTLVVLLDQHPDQLALVRQTPRLIENAIDEALRTCPVPGVLMRRTVRDVELSGVRVAAGTMVAASLDSADHDELHFQDADRFDVTRPNAKEHLTFGKGRHLCSGFPLARVTARVALTELYDRLPNLHVTGPIERVPVPNRRLLTRLHVAWG
jgi:cytochrome P450